VRPIALQAAAASRGTGPGGSGFTSGIGPASGSTMASPIASPIGPGLSDAPASPREHEPLPLADLETLARLMERAPAVQRRHQFFVWSQSELQALLPHAVLTCAAWSRARRELEFDLFHAIVLPAPVLASLAEARGPLLAAVASAWVQGGGRALVLPLAHFTAEAAGPAAQLALASGAASLLVHGVARPQRPAEIETLFAFANPAVEPGLVHLRRAEVVVPVLHAVWQRVVAGERAFAPRPALAVGAAGLAGLAAASALPPPAAEGARVTERERQILAWVREGKSNHQIGTVLGISPLTVKNHVQKILRKLVAANRAQAVARAIALGVLPDGRGDPR
jgi:transcriptional regulator EpsA